MKRIAVISDTHGLLRPEVIQIVTGCDAIIHGGDINNQKILDQLCLPPYVVPCSHVPFIILLYHWVLTASARHNRSLFPHLHALAHQRQPSCAAHLLRNSDSAKGTGLGYPAW